MWLHSSLNKSTFLLLDCVSSKERNLEVFPHRALWSKWLFSKTLAATCLPEGILPPPWLLSVLSHKPEGVVWWELHLKAHADCPFSDCLQFQGQTPGGMGQQSLAILSSSLWKVYQKGIVLFRWSCLVSFSLCSFRELLKWVEFPFLVVSCALRQQTRYAEGLLSLILPLFWDWFFVALSSKPLPNA